MQGVTILVAFVFLLSCCMPWLGASFFWWMGFVGLAVPYLITLLFFFAIIWLFAKPIWVLIPIISLAIGHQQITRFFAFNGGVTFKDLKHKHTIRIIDWNVRSFNGISANNLHKKIIRTELAASILKLNPDIICLQEFSHSFGNQNAETDNLGLFSKTHKYHYFSRDYSQARGYTSGSIIFSKFPIVDTGKLAYPKGESMIYADITQGTDTFRVFTTHLQSFKFKKADYDNIEKIAETDEDAIGASKSIFYKMKPAFKRRAVQARMVKDWCADSPYPSIITGDFNDVPNSYAYQTIRGNRQDAFLETSFGIGKTYFDLAPTLRIDYILPDKHFNVQQFEMVDEGLSDHIMLVADLALKAAPIK